MKSQKTAGGTVQAAKRKTLLEEPVPIDALDTLRLNPSNGTQEADREEKQPTGSFPQEQSSEEVQLQETEKKIRLDGMAGLAVILGQLVSYFSNRVDVDDIDVFSFCLHHLFCRVDFLYRTALPQLGAHTSSSPAEQSPIYELLSHQRIWTDLQIIRQALNRMAPLCHLLNSATESILDALDVTSEKAGANQISRSEISFPAEEEAWLLTLDQDRWERALSALTISLEKWQDSRSKLAPMSTQFASLLSEVPEIARLDEIVNVLLVSAEAIFGDILPGFQAVSHYDDEAVATLLFDLMQQSDQLLAQFEAILEILSSLIEHVAVKVNI